MALLRLSSRQPDLLAKTIPPEDECFQQLPLASKLNLEAPKNTSSAVPHELASEDSRIRDRVVDYINAQRLLSGTAYAEQLLLELNSASQINRGPDGIFESSRLHWDMILGRDERIYPFELQPNGFDLPNVAYRLLALCPPELSSKISVRRMNSIRPGPPVVRPNPLHITFKNPNWPANFITPENALEYFCNSDNAFYDKSSCNENVRMQNISRPLEECLLSMTGIQYVLWSAQPPLYVICKHRRNNMQNVTPLAYYYIINGTVYQAPDVYTFVQSRLLGAVEPLKNAFDHVIQYSRYNVAKGYYWQFDKKLTMKREDEKSEEEKPLQARSTHFQKTRTHMLMQNLFEMFPAGNVAIPNPAEKSEAMELDEKAESNGDVTHSQATEAATNLPAISATKPK